MRLKFEPMDQSCDLVLVRDAQGIALGALHLDVFHESPLVEGPIYLRLASGESVTCELSIAEDGDRC